jgi:protein TonB
MQALRSLWRCVMSNEKRVKAEPRAGTFSGCLVEGDAEETARERKSKRRAVVISITLQTAGLAALVIAPLFAKPAVLVERVATPIPPYGHTTRHETAVQREHTRNNVCVICPTAPIRPITAATTNESSQTTPIGPIIEGIPGADGPPNLINGSDSRRPPVPPDDIPRVKKPVLVGHIDPALLTRRIEPVYPALARQLHRNGKVELRAIIGTDGTVQSLQVVSGDPLFINSAREAVLQWRYKPTYLNGEPVEIDTFITVIYTLQ